MTPHAPGGSLRHVLSVHIQHEKDLVIARQRARQISELLGFGHQDQTRIATAVSEICRNAHQYARGGLLDFSVDLRTVPQFFWIEVSDRGSGIADVGAVLAVEFVSKTGTGIGLAGTSRLMDDFRITSSPGEGTTVRFGKAIPSAGKPIDMGDVGRFCAKLTQQGTGGVAEELDRQNHDLMETLDALRQREAELERRQQELVRLNLELEETNRGVMALYAELDEKAAALRRADEMKSRFLSHVSHEFRTPVNSVLALTRLLLERADGDLSPEQERQVVYIREAARQLAEMVNDLLDLAKVEAGKTEIRMGHIEVDHFLGAIRALMRPLVTNDAVSLIFEEPSPSFAFESDESKLGQILRNLISNALKFTQQGEVRVTARMSPSEGAVVFAVSDTGIGIAPEDQDRVFNEFTQVEHPIQKNVKGTGLGLPLSRKLATLLGGTLVLESALGKGSTFTLTVPFQVSSEQIALGDNAGIRERSKTILVVDDDRAIRYLAHRLFQGTAHEIVEATGADAAERARFEAPALVLLDLNMPDRSGFEVLDDLASADETKGIPVVIHTAKAITEADYARLANRHAVILPKSAEGRRAALSCIRAILGEPHLFSSEPEFS